MRGRVFGVLGMLVSVASFLPIIIVGPISDLVGTTAVIFGSAIIVVAIGVASVVTRGPLQASDARPAVDPNVVDPIAAALRADRPSWREPGAVTPPSAGPAPAFGVRVDPTDATARVGQVHAGPPDPTDGD